MKQSLLLCLFVLCTIWQTQASAQSSPSGTISTINAVPCTLPCNCKWRITFWDKPSEKINVSQGPFNQHIQRSQDVTNGVPYLNLYCCDNTVGAATLAGAESKGTFVIKITHIDTCKMCSGDSQQAAIIAGYSRPQAFFSGRTKGAGHYDVTGKMHADFTELSADSGINFTESGSSDGYSAKLEFGFGIGNATGGGITIQFPTSSEIITNRPHTGLFNQDQQFLTQETLQLDGHVSSDAEADALLGSEALSQAKITSGNYNAGLMFICVCAPEAGHGSSGAPAPTGAGTPGPGPAGGTTGGGAGPDPAGGTTPGGGERPKPKTVVVDGPDGGAFGFGPGGKPGVKPLPVGEPPSDPQPQEPNPEPQEPHEPSSPPSGGQN